MVHSSKSTASHKSRGDASKAIPVSENIEKPKAKKPEAISSNENIILMEEKHRLSDEVCISRIFLALYFNRNFPASRQDLFLIYGMAGALIY